MGHDWAQRPRLTRRALVDHRFDASIPAVLHRVYAGRGVSSADELALEFARMLVPTGLLGLEVAVDLLEAAIKNGERIVIAGDYDADGATGVALAVLGLRAMGAAQVDYVVPNRVTMGYGLSPPLAEAAAALGAQLLVTVDNGIASIAGVAAARRLGMRVIVTDHHLPGPELPLADALVNPNQPGCGFPSKSLAGVGVMFYLLAALRARLRQRGHFTVANEPKLADWLDLVAVGTVADVARLDRNNRILVAQGIARLRSGRGRPGLLAMLAGAGRDPSTLTASDLGFVLGPRINAAGRLADIRTGIECLLAETLEQAQPLAETLERINRERREIQRTMTEDAVLQIAEDVEENRAGVTVFDPDWHEGVVGPVASKIKERVQRPVIAFAPGQGGDTLKGSARSIPGFNVRDAIALVEARHPGLIERFGGHAMAAGLSLRKANYRRFQQAFDEACRVGLPEGWNVIRIETDGPLANEEFNVQTALAIERGGPWGTGFEEPRFDNCFEVAEARIVGSDGSHAKYRLRLIDGPPTLEISAIDFGGAERLCRKGRLRAVYAVGVNRFRDRESLDLRLEYLEPI
ncbi:MULTISPECIES: single-stranded-DNA-specific exonuclease RecJ [Hydrocarboniphaga]|uniref:Single-stranded-DNA-specific exonuclease RecJ n=1 Tax=Hydrocarboniphaga effusa AP103 TaxID=1172194 RepID=I8HXF6_9GAMM|nr:MULTISPECIES: single-stranded-DNA-specific exonuclease RecJ [Hydrocarboniphaga]EIT68061.1 hypothetical protein WQQ_44960 [Hydrocarboniphaga effusa AP103]MDZ4078137.1 single-stranded-DNA-specific exonuclease RecJ [Hydrocarboniphaga sp.]